MNPQRSGLPEAHSTSETGARGSESRVVGSSRRLRALVRRQWIAQRREPGYVVTLLALPVVDALLFTTIGQSYGSGPTAERVLFTGILLFHLAWQLTLAGSLGLLEDVWERNLLNLFTTPTTEAEYGAALFIVGLVRALVAGALIAAVGAGLYALDVGAAGLVLVPASIVLVVFGWAIALFVIGMTLQFGERAEVFSWAILVVLMPISGVFYPVEDLPGFLPSLAGVIPVTRVFTAVRTDLSGGGAIAGDLWVAALGSAVLVGLFWMFVVAQLRRFRRRGWISQFM